MIFITGGAGFVGTRLANNLAASNQGFLIGDLIPSFDFPNQSKIVDIRNADSLRDATRGVDAIVHLAAVHRDDIQPLSLYAETNVAGTENVVSAAEANNINTIVFTSSVACYGFAAPGTDENGAFNPFNEYGRTKAAGEKILKDWQARDSSRRTLIIIRPTVIFGERNRGNVYNLLKQIHSRRFMMIGRGVNVKSMAYVENVAKFLEFSLSLGSGLHIYNYVDKPDMRMHELVSLVNASFGRKESVGFVLPYWAGLAIGTLFDFAAKLLNRKFSISKIRVKKFCSSSEFNTSVELTGFKRAVDIRDALKRTIDFEFNSGGNRPERVFETE